MRATAALLTLMLLGSACASTTVNVIGQPLPSSNALTALTAAEPGFAEAIQGRVVLVDFWASWCEPCKAGVPKLQKLATAYAGSDLVVVGINVGEEPDLVRAFIKDAGLTYQNFLDADFEFADAVSARSLPTLLLLDRSGTIVHRSTTLNADVLARIRALLK